MFDSGFSLNTARTADVAGETAGYIARLADDLGCLVQGGRTVRACTGSSCLAKNHATVFGPEERLLADYAKVHPFTFGRESEAFEGGDAVVTYPWPGPDGGDGGDGGGLTVCPAICYDLRFPELFRLGLLRGAEVFAIGANWPEARQAHWRALCIARAIENQAFVLAVNRAGPDPHLTYVGGSIAVDPQGEVIGELGAGEGILSVEVDPERVRSWRATFSAWKDLRLMGPGEHGRVVGG